LEQIALQMAMARSILSEDVYKEETDKYRGERELEISHLGVLAELIAMHGLSIKGIGAKFTNIVDTCPQIEPDITLQNGDTIDVKGLKGKYLRVNANAHDNKDKRPQFYWFIKPNSNYQAENYLFSSTSIGNWEKVESTYTEVYQLKLDE